METIIQIQHLQKHFGNLKVLNDVVFSEIKKYVEEKFAKGIGWGEVKKQTFELINSVISPMREKYDYYISHPEIIDEIFEKSAIEVRKIAKDTLNRVEKAIGRL